MTTLEKSILGVAIAFGTAYVVNEYIEYIRPDCSFTGKYEIIYPNKGGLVREEYNFSISNKCILEEIKKQLGKN